MTSLSTLAAVEVIREKERQDETQFTTKIGGKTSFGSQLFCSAKFSFPVTHLMPKYVKLAVLCP
jgi:hypothetical protein